MHWWGLFHSGYQVVQTVPAFLLAYKMFQFRLFVASVPTWGNESLDLTFICPLPQGRLAHAKDKAGFPYADQATLV